MPESCVQDILKLSRKNNEKLGITGILIYFNGIFTQFFEGPEEAVDLLYQKICADKRHTNIKLLLSDYHPTRYYADWSMAYRSLYEEELYAILGYQRLDRENLFSNAEELGHLGVSLLRNFVQGLHLD